MFDLLIRALGSVLPFNDMMARVIVLYADNFGILVFIFFMILCILYVRVIFLNRVDYRITKVDKLDEEMSNRVKTNKITLIPVVGLLVFFIICLIFSLIQLFISICCICCFGYISVYLFKNLNRLKKGMAFIYNILVACSKYIKYIKYFQMISFVVGIFFGLIGGISTVYAEESVIDHNTQNTRDLDTDVENEKNESFFTRYKRPLIIGGIIVGCLCAGGIIYYLYQEPINAALSSVYDFLFGTPAQSNQSNQSNLRISPLQAQILRGYHVVRLVDNGRIYPPVPPLRLLLVLHSYPNLMSHRTQLVNIYRENGLL